MAAHRRRLKLLGWSEVGGEWSSSSSATYGRPGSKDDDESTDGGVLWLLGRDLVLSFLWAWTLTVVDLIGGDSVSGFRKGVLYILGRLFIAWLCTLTAGGMYNPLTTLTAAVSEGSEGLFAAVLGRIPAQAIGYVLGVKTIIRIIPEYYGGPTLKVNIHLGAITEGTIALVLVITYLLLMEIDVRFFPRLFISSIVMLTLRNLGSLFSCGWNNPGSAFGWAYAKGNHMSVEHLFVYWFVPFLTTLFGIRVFNSIVHPEKNRDASYTALGRWKAD